MKKITLKKVLLTTLVGLSAVSLASCANEGAGSTNTGSAETNPGTGTNTPSTETGSGTGTVTPEPEHKLPFEKANFANGAQNYVAKNYEERTEILGLLEKYAFDNNLTGLTLFGDGGYVMYSPDVKKGSNEYINGYGFGVASEGEITADLKGETNPAWKRYYHTALSNDPKTINQMNDQGSVVSDIISNVAATYFTSYMNQFKDGYEWGGVLSKQDRPIAVNATDNGLATKYRVEVRVGNELKYSTKTKDPNLQKYNNREVKLEDYIVPYVMHRTQSFNMLRGGEQLTGAGSIKGMKTYFTKSKNVPLSGIKDLWESNVGIKPVVENGKSYIEFEFNVPTNQFYAMYYLSSTMAAPVPAEFIKDLGNGDFAAGVANFGNYTEGKLTPVDTYLSTGPYTLAYWEKDKTIVMDKNPNYVENHSEGRYKIQGVHYEILKSMNTDQEALLKEFEADKVHACGIPRTQLAKYRNDPRTTQTKDNSTFKLNMNTTTKDEWEALFGEHGSVKQTAKDQYWEVEPAMSNDNFIKGLNYSINRNEFAAALGKTPSSNYFGNGYLSDPENGISYNETKAHKNAVKDLLNGTENGYNLEYAKASFKKASEELIAQGYYSEGETISIRIDWQTPSDRETFHNTIAKYFTDAFNNCGGGLKLEVEFHCGAVWSDVYDYMRSGQFDIGFGSISGNSLNPLNFLEVLKSDNASGFTLNWGTDTSKVTEELYYDNMYWSFDALWLAADQGGFFKEGYSEPTFVVPAEADKPVVNADGTVTIKFKVNAIKNEDVYSKINGVVICGLSDLENGSDYTEADVTAFEVADDGTVTVTLSKEVYEQFKGFAVTSLDVYYSQSIAGIQNDLVKSLGLSLS